MRVSRDLRTLAHPLRPAVLYLTMNTEQALRRAVAARGSLWFERHAVGEVTETTYEERILALSAMYGRRDRVRRRVLESGGWAPIYLDAGGSRHEVARAALTAVGLDTDAPLLS